jgi:dienelactone hydrolase
MNRSGGPFTARGVIFVLACMLALLCAGISQAQQLPGRIEIHSVRSRTLTGVEFLKGGASGTEALLGGELRFPPGPAAKVPVVVLIHGSGGVGPGVEGWARALNDAGIAAFILDTFTGRGIVSTVENQDQLHSLAMMVDAYRALDVLAAHPRIRADRIAVMGFSKGAVASVFSASDRFRTAYGSSMRFAAHIGLYTPCNTRFDGDTKVARVPIRLFHGITDDYVSIGPCREFVAELKSAGVDVLLTEYPDSQHAFDNPNSPRLVDIPKAQSTRNCKLRESANGVIVNAASGAPFTMADPCVAIGAHVGYNAESTSAARLALTTFLKQALLN